MFERAGVIFLYAEQPLHPGSGGSVGAVDLPVQRERFTHYPMIQGPGVKGGLKDAAKGLQRRWAKDSDPALQAQAKSLARNITVVFGPDSQAHEHGSALSLTDARILLFPVRSLAGTFGWITCPYVIERLKRDLRLLEVGRSGPPGAAGAIDTLRSITVPDDLKRLQACTSGPDLQEGGHVYLEEFAFQVLRDDVGQGAQPSQAEGSVAATPAAETPTQRLARWLAANVLPAATPDTYGFWREILQSRLVVLHDDDFQHFVRFATEVNTRIQLGETGTVAQGPWDEECLPMETVLYSMALASVPKAPRIQGDTLADADQVLTWLKGDLLRTLSLVQFGGDETVGRGLVRLTCHDALSLASGAETRGSVQTPPAPAAALSVSASPSAPGPPVQSLPGPVPQQGRFPDRNQRSYGGPR